VDIHLLAVAFLSAEPSLSTSAARLFVICGARVAAADCSDPLGGQRRAHSRALLIKHVCLFDP